MRFQVPQFIEMEAKIFGPLTFKQFIYLVGGAGSIIVLYSLLGLVLAIIFGLPLAVFCLALAFYKVHNQPFIKVVENAFCYFTGSRLYLWRKRGIKAAPKEEKAEAIKQAAPYYIPKLTKNKLGDLAWSLDIKEKIGR